jgi:DNA invertase Pin-like site-specific DNA recombinase
MHHRPKAYSYLRMSSELQLRGDSRRRQLELSQRYAADHDLELADDAQMEDIGISAFKGANIKEGALGRFLDSAKSGKIEPGSYLLVESLDRLTRQEVRKSLSIFLSIIDAGITIVTLADGRVYTPEATEEIELITSLVILSRAHEESRTKSVRIRSAWANKRANAASRPLTAMCPAWLRLSRDKSRYDVIADRAEVVRSIFNDTVNGIGNYSITQRLNKRGVPHFGKSNGWHNSYVAKILANRAVIGEFQPHKLVDGKRQPTGEPIRNYFPPIIEEELFYRAQASRKQRLQQARGRKGEFVSNLFSGLTTCAYCKSKMKFENKGPGPKGGTFLVCDNAKRGLGCSGTRWRYNQFEASFLGFVQELDLERVIKADDEAKKRAELESQLNALRGELSFIEKQRDDTFQLYLKGGAAVEFFHQKLTEIEEHRSQLESVIKQKEELLTQSIGTTEVRKSKDEIKSLIGRLQTKRDDDVYKLRSQIASHLRSVVVTLLIAPVGRAPIVEQSIDFLRSSQGDVSEIMGYLRASDPHRDHRRYFVVGLIDGTVRAVYPHDDDPLQFEEQVIATKRGPIVRVLPGSEELILEPGGILEGDPDQAS